MGCWVNKQKVHGGGATIFLIYLGKFHLIGGGPSTFLLYLGKFQLISGGCHWSTTYCRDMQQRDKVSTEFYSASQGQCHEKSMAFFTQGFGFCICFTISSSSQYCINPIYKAGVIFEVQNGRSSCCAKLLNQQRAGKKIVVWFSWEVHQLLGQCHEILLLFKRFFLGPNMNRLKQFRKHFVFAKIFDFKAFLNRVSA